MDQLNIPIKVINMNSSEKDPLEEVKLFHLTDALSYWKSGNSYPYSGLCSYFQDRHDISYDKIAKILLEYNMIDRPGDYIAEPGEPGHRVEALTKLIMIKKQSLQDETE